MNLARAGFLGYDVALEMTSYLNREDSFIPWQSTYASLTYISSMLTFDADYGLWRVRWITSIFTYCFFACRRLGQQLNSSVPSVLLPVAMWCPY